MSDDDESLEEQIQKHTNVLESCRSRRKLFEDPDFPASDWSIEYENQGQPTGYTWLRPRQINPKATFIQEGFSRSDINQGALGDCWILAAMAGMAERKDIVSRVVPDGQSMDDGYCGAFRFRMRKFGKEFEVLVDDRLPTKNGEAVYTKPLGGEFWVCLLEKALAKLYGCYKSLDGGHTFEALADLTGGLSEEIVLSGWKNNLSELARYVDKCINRKGSVLGASSIRNENGKDSKMDNGIVFSHAYTITGMKSIQVKTGSAMSRWRQVDLIRLRNPHGKTEWTGKWSDDYWGWSRNQKRSVELISRDDGEFWMSFDDFSKFYRSLTIVHFCTPSGVDAATGREWQSYEFFSEWKRGKTSGGKPSFRDTHFNNPQFAVNLVDSLTDEDDKATCLVSVEERYQHRLPHNMQKYVAKAVYLYSLPYGKDRVSLSDLVRPVAVSSPYTGSCRTHVHRFRVTPGRYAVMAGTSKPTEEARFLIRIYTEV